MVNALGGSNTPCTNDRLRHIFEALLDELETMPEFHGIKGELSGLMVIPIGLHKDSAGDITSYSGLTSYVGKRRVIPPIAFTKAIAEAGARWYSWANGDRVNVLEAYAAGDIERHEIERLLGESIAFTAQNLGFAEIPTDRAEVGRMTQAVRASLASK